MAILQVRVDDELKNQANEIYNELGLDISTAIRMFLKRTVVVGGLPFDTRVGDSASRGSVNTGYSPPYVGSSVDTEETLEEINEEIRKAREERKKGNN